MKIIKTPAEIDTRLKSFVVVADSETAMKIVLILSENMDMK